MSEALYRKYRPQTFDDVVGQTHIERTLKNAIESDKVSHAYLFCGPRGTGKTTTARLLAKALLCERGPTPSPDGTCEQCVAIAEGTHPDVNELDAASRTGVENVREEIIGRVQYAPTRGRFKIYIIDEVHMLSTAAFNALLKTLEEPPSHVVFILCTTDPQKVPDTIHSRCQRFDFHRLSNEEIVSRLGAVCMAEGVEFEGDALDLVAHRAQGGMRDALTTLEQLIAFGNGAVTVDVARSVLGSFDIDDMSVIAQHIAARDAAACFTWMAEYVETGADLAQFARDLATYMRDLYVLALTDGAVAVSAAQSSLPRMAQEAEQFGADRLAYALRVLGDLNIELRTAANPRLSFEIALTRMVRPSSDLTLEALAARVEALEAQLAQGSAPAALAATVPPSSVGFKPVQPADSAQAQVSVQTNSTPAQAQGRAQATAQVPVQAQLQRASQVQRVASSVPAQSQAQPARQAASASTAQPASRQQANPFAARATAQSGANPFAARAAAQAASAQQVAQAEHAAAPAMPAGEVSAALAAKLANPAALQRGWQATLAELKRQRAAYGALLLSARVSAAAGGRGIAVEFSKENSFAYSAAQKPDISAALSQALALSFGEAVPFAITQAQASQAAAPQMRQQAAASQPARDAHAAQSARAAALQARGFAAPVVQPAAAPASQTPSVSAPPAWEDDVVPYDDADVAAYEEGDAAPFDDAAVAPAAPMASAASHHATPTPQVALDFAPGSASAQALDALAPSALKPVQLAAPKPAVARSHQERKPHESVGEQQENPDSPAVWEPRVKPVDAYDAGKKLGFTSMPPRTLKKSKSLTEAKGWPGAGKASRSSATAQTSPASAAPAVRFDAEEMPIEDIFGIFGVSMQDVVEER